MKNKRERGFTLIELLMVISIISLLSSVVFSSLSYSRLKARDTVRKSNLSEIQKALELYHLQYGSYPYGQDNGGFYGTNVTTCASDWDWCWTETNGLAKYLKPYIESLPQDPLFDKREEVMCDGKWYVYVYERLGPDSYCIAGTLENEKDPNIMSCEETCHYNQWANYYFLKD